MKRTLYILAVLTILAGCSSKELDAPTAPVTASPPAPEMLTENPPASKPAVATTLTEEDKAEIAAKYGLEKPDQPAGNVSVQVGISNSATQPTQPGVKAIAGKLEADVTALLGKPIATEKGEWTLMSSETKTLSVRHTYNTDVGEISVRFIEGVAARIEVKPNERFQYPDDAIKAMRAVGLQIDDGLQSESSAPHFMDYGGIDGVYAVRVVKDLEGNTENIGYVKIVTEERFK